MYQFKSEYMRNNEWQPGATFDSIPAKLKSVRMTAIRIGAQGFRIVRTSDNVVLIESKQPPANPSAASEVASEPQVAPSDSKCYTVKKHPSRISYQVWNGCTNKPVKVRSATYMWTTKSVAQAECDYLNNVSDTAPVADDAIPFAEGIDNSAPIADYDAQVIAERAKEVKARLELPYQTDDLVSFADAFTVAAFDSEALADSEDAFAVIDSMYPDSAFAEAIAAVSGDVEYYDSLLAPQPVSIWTHKLPVAENAPRYQKTRKTARKREIPRFVVQLANMQRMHPANRVIRKNTRPVVNIADVLRQLGIGKAA